MPSVAFESIASARRLPAPEAFAEASARVEAALNALRDAEAALERQLSDLRVHRLQTMRAEASVVVAYGR